MCSRRCRLEADTRRTCTLFVSQVAALLISAGGVGFGSKIKAVNQLLAGVHICATAEATAFARHKGMDLEAVYEVVSKGAASSYCMKDRKCT